ncbi:hypothetical protein ACOME3_000241 [Neoechinorhynchus agilis]
MSSSHGLPTSGGTSPSTPSPVKMAGGMPALSPYMASGLPTPINLAARGNRSPIDRGSQSPSNESEPKHSYICYSCGDEVQLTVSERVKCSGCGLRILLKKKVDVSVQYDAR